MKISENKPHSIHLRLTDEQYEFCKTSAELMGVGTADFIRMLVNANVVLQKRMTVKVDDSNVPKLGDLVDYENDKDNIKHQL